MAAGGYSLELATLLNHAVLPVLGDLLGRPFAFRCLIQVLAPGIAAYGGVVEDAMGGIGFGIVPGPLALGDGSLGLAPALATGCRRRRRRRRRCSAAGVSVVKTDCRLLSATSVGSAPSRVGTLSLHCEPEPVGATVFVDASYDGEVMVAAGDIAYTAGREAIATYNESLAGARAPGFAGVSGPQHVDALRAIGDEGPQHAERPEGSDSAGGTVTGGDTVSDSLPTA